MFCGWNRPEKAVQRIDVFVRDLAQRPERHGAIDGAAIGPLAASEHCRQRLRIRVARHYAIQSRREDPATTKIAEDNAADDIQ